MPARSRSNALALAVLSLLTERPMHPYEMATTLRSRAKEESIKLNYGSLYSVVDSLAKRGLIEPAETLRDGRRPERTVYTVTEPGRVEFADWLSELISVPVKEFTSFEAALSMLPGLPPDVVAGLLRLRVHRLSSMIDGGASALRRGESEGLPRLMSIEFEYRLTLARAELTFVEALLADLDAGTLEGYELWRTVHQTGEMPPDDEVLARIAAERGPTN
ncbi:PadR family transcriptional regulator [Pseudonocardia sulfidoxydans NBRC 16205]|uniref:PadR family transcriptional regulator n=1 Tax=Pseudonocardia sulfidoxydans NBRC 16205 TaxID=1223511 RepID=A0A511D9H7_9PSEU|nr:PadR family transcriptional regulator [Pseudonocardia sulfidoxydans]GEL21257.1 PadR family transcriptional regulator [Pseudonocardia sulfidoxydans NBRC 16205]